MKTKNMISKKIDGVALADRIKRIEGKKRITKNEAILVADFVKMGMTRKFLRDLDEIEKSRAKSLLAV